MGGRIEYRTAAQLAQDVGDFVLIRVDDREPDSLELAQLPVALQPVSKRGIQAAAQCAVGLDHGAGSQISEMAQRCEILGRIADVGRFEIDNTGHRPACAVHQHVLVPEVAVAAVRREEPFAAIVPHHAG